MKLKVDNVTKYFKKNKALDSICFEVKRNQVVGLLGPNGAGKTTLMRILSGFYGLNSGCVYWEGKAVDPKDKSFKSRVGYLAENNPLYGGMTVAEYLFFTARIKGLNGLALKAGVNKTAAECGLTTVMETKIEVLSKGYKQRVGLASSLIGDPDLIILDEPTSGLDPNQIKEIREVIRKLAKNKVVIMSTHILPEAKAVCGRLLIINRGRIVLDERTAGIKNLEKKFIELTV